ncbi:hypothetical protein COU19_01950 [Candidatus Kaiserbacteria bacterium CG10_big_fil_rev_8_21_14_0_10_56_12]|uniref:Rod shape-determining protein MreD n=1 Tax=Candidatus Kaiserbacteria bacterium CG10_big_fil_rev_8_21_14_0_10_56_12 TaxID=1974611 RepID=A0A2H0UBJ4_9BACT|nr:MAG: hypothetical protein COU19_01950 [Candidatus Kaiserbacteria bacterium CG10_big_fil_rev_8_21_14_0_10_56_12]
MQIEFKTGWLKFVIGWATVFLFRLIPFRPPNVEPMLATIMPFSKRYGSVASFLFGFLGIALFDAVTSGWGVWTLVTALTYGALGPVAHLYFKNREATAKNFVIFGVVGTVIYDAITGVAMGPLLFHQSLAIALAGQIPFTLMHLTGAVLFSALLSPEIYRWVVQNDAIAIRVPHSKVVA